MIKSCVASLFMLISLDFIWLDLIMKRFNLEQLSSIGRVENGHFRMLVLPTILAYFLLAFALAYFSIPKASEAKSGGGAFLQGAVLGLVIYGIFDLTNLSILKGYPVLFAFADISWGCILCGITTWALGYRYRFKNQFEGEK